MTDINELKEMIIKKGGKASLEEVVNEYQKSHPMVIFNEHRNAIKRTLLKNKSGILYDEGNSTYVISDSDLPISEKNVQITDSSHKSQTEALLSSLIKDDDRLKINIKNKINTNVLDNDKILFSVYYRKEEVRIELNKIESPDEIYNELNNKGLAFQHNNDGSGFEQNKSFYVKEENEEEVYKYLLNNYIALEKE